MTHRNSAGKQAVRLAIFRGDTDPVELQQAAQYVAPNNYFSLVWYTATRCCLYVHDEYTPGGHRIACTDMAAPEKIVGLRYDDCTIFIDVSDEPTEEVTRTISLEVPELCLHASDLTLNEETNQVCLVMSDGTQHCIDLTPVLPVYDVRASTENPGQYCFYHGDEQIICWWQGGFSVENEDGTVTITNPDGTTVTIPAPMEATDLEIRHMGDRQRVCLVMAPQGAGDEERIVGCWQQGDIVSEDTVAGVHYAVKPDGTIVSWVGTDHITLASLNAANQTVTIVNPDGQSITFPYGPGEEYELHVGAGIDGTGDAGSPITTRSAIIPHINTAGCLEVPASTTVGATLNEVANKLCDIITGEATFQIQDMAQVCTLGQVLVAVPAAGQPGRFTLGRVSQAAQAPLQAGFNSVSGQPPETQGLQIPGSFASPTNFYEPGNFQTDGGNDTNPYNMSLYGARRAAPGLNAARITNSRFAAFDLNLACARVFDQSVVVNHVNAALVQDAYGQISSFAYRMRVMEGGTWSPWLYPFAPASGLLTRQGVANGINQSNNHQGTLLLPSGQVQLHFFYVAPASGFQPWSANTNTISGGAGALLPRVVLTPRSS